MKFFNMIADLYSKLIALKSMSGCRDKLDVQAPKGRWNKELLPEAQRTQTGPYSFYQVESGRRQWV